VTVADPPQPQPQPQPQATTAGELGGLDAHPHASAVLLPALAPGARPSHAYLFHGPPGTGKRTAARAFAAALLADEPGQVAVTAERIARSSHPDLTWVTPSGASEMLVADIEAPVIADASRTPFESARRVFVIEAVETMNDQAANRMLKTLEEPAPFVHLLLLTDRPQDVLETITSRCQPVRFDPLPPARVAERLERSGIDAPAALASARLAMGDARMAERLATPGGRELRASAEAFVRAALDGDTGGTGERPWLALLDAARAAGERAGEQADRRLAENLELLPAKERKRAERDAVTDRRRVERRERTRTLDEGLRLAELWLRDVLCVREGAPDLIYAVDRRDDIETFASRARESVDLEHPIRDSEHLARAIELVADTRLSLAQNVSEELALEALAYRLAIGPRFGSRP
jgi:DNA polymerase-3 subunit delta'